MEKEITLVGDMVLEQGVLIDLTRMMEVEVDEDVEE